MVGDALLDRHGPALQRDVPELADVAEDQHVGVQVEGLAAVAGQLGDGEAGEGEVGARALADVPGLGQVQVDQGTDLHRAARMPADRVLEHRHRQKLGPIGPHIHAHHVLHLRLRAASRPSI